MVGVGRCRRFLGFYENMDGPCHVCMHEPMKIFHVTRGGQLPKEGQDPRDEDLLMFEGSKIELQIKHKIFVSQESCGKTMSTTRFDLLRPLCYGGVHEQ